MPRRKATGPEVEIKSWENDADLRTVSHGVKYLKAITRKHKLMPGQGVLYSNKNMSRLRMVANFGGLVVLVIFPADETKRMLNDLFLWAVRWAIDKANNKTANRLRLAIGDDVVVARAA